MTQGGRVKVKCPQHTRTPCQWVYPVPNMVSPIKEWVCSRTIHWLTCPVLSKEMISTPGERTILEMKLLKSWHGNNIFLGDFAEKIVMTDVKCNLQSREQASYLDNCYKTSCSSAPSTLSFWYTLLMMPTMDKQHFYLCMMKLIKQDNKFNEKIKNCCHIVATMITTTSLGLQHEELNL